MGTIFTNGTIGATGPTSGTIGPNDSINGVIGAPVQLILPVEPLAVKKHSGFCGHHWLPIIPICAVTCENRSSGFPIRADTNQAAQLLNKARDLKYRI